MTTGTVKFFNETKGFGFIKEDDSENELFVHVTAIASGEALVEGAHVEYEEVEGNNGKTQASNVVVID